MGKSYYYEFIPICPPIQNYVPIQNYTPIQNYVPIQNYAQNYANDSVQFSVASTCQEGSGCTSQSGSIARSFIVNVGNLSLPIVSSSISFTGLSFFQGTNLSSNLQSYSSIGGNSIVNFVRTGVASVDGGINANGSSTSAYGSTICLIAQAGSSITLNATLHVNFITGDSVSYYASRTCN